MFKSIREVFRSLESTDQQDSLHRQHIAVAVLLLEVANSDYKLAQVETDRLLQVLKRQWCISDNEAADILAKATLEADAHASLHEHLKLINSQLDHSQRRSLIQGLWEIAWADGEIHHYEEHLIRRLADLLHVSHSDFIRLKHHAKKTI